MPLHAPDELHRRAACVHIERGMFDEAQAELEKIDPFRRLLPELLAARSGEHEDESNTSRFVFRLQIALLPSIILGVAVPSCERRRTSGICGG
jgi:hypothetical protein